MQWIIIQQQKGTKGETRYNMGKPWKRYVKWKKPDTKTHILPNSIYKKCLTNFSVCELHFNKVFI